MKILNIDAFAHPARELHHRGKVHPVKEPSVQAFIDNMAMAEAIEKSGQDTPREQIQMSLKMIADAIPTLSAEEIGAFNLEQVTVLLEFIRGELDRVGSAPAAEGAEQGDNKS